MPKGRKILKITGILMIVFGVLGMIIAIAGIVGYQNMDATMLADMEKIMSVSVSDLITNLSINAVVYLVMFVTGILGVVFSKNVNRAKFCLFFGVIVVILQIVAGIYSGLQSGFGFSAFLTLLAGALVPGIFIIGAWKNMRV